MSKFNNFFPKNPLTLNKSQSIKTKAKDTIITAAFVGYTFFVYNGRDYGKVFASKERIGYRLGEFIFTKKMGSIIHISDHNRRRAKKANDIRLGIRKKKKGT